MLSSDVLDIVIGVAFVYLLLSLLCSTVMEVFAGWLKLRSRDLEAGVVELLRESAAAAVLPGSQPGSGFATDLLDHPLIFALTQPRTRSILQFSLASWPVWQKAKPHLIKAWAWPPIASLRRKIAPTAAKLAPVLKLIKTGASFVWFVLWIIPSIVPWLLRIQLFTHVKGRPSYIPAETFAKALMEKLRAKASGIDSVGIPDQPPAAGLPVVAHAARPPALRPSATIAEVRAGIAALPDEELRQKLQALLIDVGEDIDKVQKSIERWFNDGMDRVSGWYKRRAQMIIVLIAIPTVTAVNADTLTMVNTLWQNPVVRTAIADSVAKTINDPNSQVSSCLESTNSSETATPTARPAGAATPTPRSGDAATPTPTPTPKPADCVDILRTQLRGLDIIGWRGAGDYSDPREPPRADFSALRPNNLGAVDWLGWTWKLFGLSITIAAISLGSNFWFDLLKKLVNIRNAGKAPSTESTSSGGGQPGGS